MLRRKLFLWLAALSLATPLRAESDPLGMVLQAKGSPELVRGGSQSPLRLADTLLAGDRIRAVGGPVVLLFCPASEAVTISPGSSVELKADRIALLEGAAPQSRSVRRCAVPQVSLGSESLERVGGLRARGDPPVTLYLGGPVSTSRPRFEWENLEGAAEYEVVVKNDLGVEVWSADVASSPALYPDGSPELKPGYYAWEVTARAGGETVGRQLARFQVKPDPELSAMGESVPTLLRATALENAGYYAEAAALYRALREENPGEGERLTRRLAWLYWNSGLITAANEERQRLEGGERD